MADNFINAYSRARLDDRQITELIGMARGMLADGHLHDLEIEALRAWLVALEGVSSNPLLEQLLERVEEVLADGVVDAAERLELFETLAAFCGGPVEVGELLRSTSLPLCDPPPNVFFSGSVFCFTGTFVFGSRRECEEVTSRGGEAGSLTKRTRFLVIGEYATDAWIQSSYGRKIEKAATMRASGVPISIISEPHWRTAFEISA